MVFAFRTSYQNQKAYQQTKTLILNRSVVCLGPSCATKQAQVVTLGKYFFGTANFLLEFSGKSVMSFRCCVASFSLHIWHREKRNNTIDGITAVQKATWQVSCWCWSSSEYIAFMWSTTAMKRSPQTGPRAWKSQRHGVSLYFRGILWISSKSSKWLHIVYLFLVHSRSSRPGKWNETFWISATKKKVVLFLVSGKEKAQMGLSFHLILSKSCSFNPVPKAMGAQSKGSTLPYANCTSLNCVWTIFRKGMKVVRVSAKYTGIYMCEANSATEDVFTFWNDWDLPHK